MKWEMTGGSTFPLLKFTLEQGEAIKAQSGSMVALSSAWRWKVGPMAASPRRSGGMFSGQSFFMQHVTAVEKAGWVLFASPVPGGISDVEIKPGQELSVQQNGFLAGTPGVEVSTQTQGLMQGLLGGEGLFIVKLSGTGTAFLHTYGSIYPIDIPAGQQVIIDSGHLIAWDSSMNYEVTKGAVSWFSAMTSGAGFACRFTGPGRVLTQTRNPWSLGAWLVSYLPIPQLKK